MVVFILKFSVQLRLKLIKIRKLPIINFLSLISTQPYLVYYCSGVCCTGTGGSVAVGCN